ncbi:Homoserine O-acetyltransferase [Candidatus Gugararchaeum adminiculabundum]|nr:Homoserine O-acetyltransferase [Candidatus Gugararchaeum adminiculabundum]
MVFNDLSRKAITNDPDWQAGNYGKRQPKHGLSLARQLGHITYLSQDTLEKKFGRARKKNKNGKFGAEFEVQGYFNYMGKRFVQRFDANSYLYITHAIDSFDIIHGGKKTIAEALKNVKAKVLLVSFTSDWLYSPEHVEGIYSGLAEAGARAVYKKLDLPYGHDAFLIYNNTLGNVLVDFLEKEGSEPAPF